MGKPPVEGSVSQFEMHGNSQIVYVILLVGSVTSYQTAIGPKLELAKRTDIDLYCDNNGTTCKINGEDFSFSQNGIFRPQGVYYFFSNGNGNGIPGLRFVHFMTDGERFKSVDVIPVRKDGLGYAFDRVSGEFFGNQGTGAFVIGPDKVSSAGGV